jgi:DNA-directed RNA polymerase subunit RPC12/RpoP
MKREVRVVETETGKIVKRVELSDTSDRYAERVMSGMRRNLNTEVYHLDLAVKARHVVARLERAQGVETSDRALTPKETERLPASFLVSWCVFCEKPDYAFIDRDEAAGHALRCPYCEHQQSLVEVVVKAAT